MANKSIFFKRLEEKFFNEKNIIIDNAEAWGKLSINDSWGNLISQKEVVENLLRDKFIEESVVDKVLYLLSKNNIVELNQIKFLVEQIFNLYEESYLQGGKVLLSAIPSNFIRITLLDNFKKNIRTSFDVSEIDIEDVLYSLLNENNEFESFEKLSNQDPFSGIFWLTWKKDENCYFEQKLNAFLNNEISSLDLKKVVVRLLSLDEEYYLKNGDLIAIFYKNDNVDSLYRPTVCEAGNNSNFCSLHNETNFGLTRGYSFDDQKRTMPECIIEKKNLGYLDIHKIIKI